MTSLLLLVLFFVLSANDAFKYPTLAKKLYTACIRKAATTSNDAEYLSSLRASRIKEALKSIPNIDSNRLKGLYDKNALIEVLLQEDSRIVRSGSNGLIRLPIIDVLFPGMVASKNLCYIGINVEINEKNIVMLLDTGATVNLLKNDLAKELVVGAVPMNYLTEGFGGGSQIAAHRGIINRMNIKAIETTLSMSNIDVALLADSRSLPPSVAGLMGIYFLQAMGCCVTFNFSQRQLVVDTARLTPAVGMSPLLSPIKKLKYDVVSVSRLYGPALMTCVISVNGVAITAMIDIGSSRTILNKEAVKALGFNYDNLTPSNQYAQGIDGNPLLMKNIVVNDVTISDTRLLGSMSSISIFAFDVPGIMNIGLGAIPACILGMDIIAASLESLTIDAANSKLYMHQSNE